MIGLNAEATDTLEADVIARPMPTADRLRQLTRWMRGLGAAVLLSAASVYLVQRWDGSGDVSRYLGLLGLTALLPLLALFCGLKLKESRSARVLLGIAASMVPMNFTILGAFLRSLVPAAESTAVSGVALWQAPGLVSAVVLVGVGVGILAPLSVLALRTLAREFTWPMSAAFLAGNLALLVPVRDATFSAILAVLMLVGLGVMQARVLRRHPALSTVEGLWARGLLLVPAVIVLARQAMLYTLDAPFFAWVLFALVAASLFGARFVPGPRRPVVEIMAVAPLAAGWVATVLALDAGTRLPDTFLVLVCVLPLGVLAIAVSAVCGPVAQRFYRSIGAAVLVLAPFFQMIDAPSPVASLLCLAFGAGVAGWSYLTRRTVLLVGSALVVLLGLIAHVYEAIRNHDWLAWVGLAAVGAAILVVTSLLDRNARQDGAPGHG